MPTPLSTITDHCIRNNKSDCVRDLAFSVFQQQYEYIVSNANPPMTPAAITATEQTLLSPGSLVAHTRAAEETMRKQFEEDSQKIRSQMKRESFWISIMTGVIGNIAYSVLLIFFFFIGKDQLSSWLSSLVQDKPAIEGKATPKENKSPTEKKQ